MGRAGGSIDLRVCMAVLAITTVASSYHSIKVVDAAHRSNASTIRFSNGVRDGNEFYCFRGFDRCMSGIEQCIKPEQECDGLNDCEDGSDEGSRCDAFDCSATGRFRCPSGRNCMNISDSNGNIRHYGANGMYLDDYLCDGLKDCADGSDEDDVLCSSCVPAPASDFARYSRRLCPGGKGCVSERQLCDGVVDCVADGGSDESDSFCKSRGCSPNPDSRAVWYIIEQLFQCQSGRCISRNRMCDGKIDCPDGDDEGSWCATTICPNDRLKCPSSRNQQCVAYSQLCDGLDDCPEGEDEMGCEDYKCVNKCPSGKQCANKYRPLCDGVRDCRDGSDEDPAFCRDYNCSAIDPNAEETDVLDDSIVSSRKIKCDGSFRCMPGDSVCDGKPDCLDGSDEDPSFCRNYTCVGSMIHCPGRIKTCINPGQLCDGTSDCLDNSDEDPTFCADYPYDQGHVLCNGTVPVYGARCDRYVDCPDKSDEANCPISAPARTPKPWPLSTASASESTPTRGI